LKGEVAVSKATEGRLNNYARIALHWYVEVMEDMVDSGSEVTTLVRSQGSWAKIRQKLESKGKVYSLSKRVVNDALPLL
jgi:hypothetical protein